MEQGDDQDQDPLDGQQPTHPQGNQTPAQDGQGGGQHATPSGQAPPSSAAGQLSQSPAALAAAARHQGREQPVDQFPVPPTKTGTQQASPRVSATGTTPPTPLTGTQLADAIKGAITAQGKIVTEEYSAHLDNLTNHS